MTTYFYGAENVANGATITTANTGATAASALTADNTHVAHGAMGIKVGSGGAIRLTVNSTRASLRMVAWVSPQPTSDYDLLRLSSTVSGAESTGPYARILANSGFLRIVSRGVNVWTSSVAVPVGEVEYRMYAEAGTTTTDGKVRLAAFMKDSSTPIAGLDSGMISGVNIGGGATTFLNARWGIVGGTLPAAGLWMDSVEYSDEVSDLLGPYVLPNIAPTANAGADFTVDPNKVDSFTLNVTAADSDGTIASYLWEDITSGAVTLSGSGSSRTVNVERSRAQASKTYRVTVTDNGGLTAADTVIVTVLPHTRWTKNNLYALVPLRRRLT